MTVNYCRQLMRFPVSWEVRIVDFYSRPGGVSLPLHVRHVLGGWPMRDSGIPEQRGNCALDWMGGLAKEALEQLASLRATKAAGLNQECLDLFMETVCGDDGDDPAAVLRVMFARHLRPEVIATQYIPEAARLLGRQWAGDSISFVQVTVCTARLQSVLHEIENAGGVGSAHAGISVLVLVPQAEQHTLGAYVLAFSLRRAGHVVCLRVSPTGPELTQLLTATRFDLALVSVSCGAGLESSVGLVRTLRLLARGTLRILVGGSIAEDDDMLLETTGADAVVRDVAAVIAEYAPPAHGGTLDNGDEIKSESSCGTRIERGLR